MRRGCALLSALVCVFLPFLLLGSCTKEEAPKGSPSPTIAEKSATPSKKGHGEMPSQGTNSPKAKVGNKKLRILLDPGHGGTNTGAPSVRPEIFEKHVTMSFADLLRTRLQEKGYTVLLTRDRDLYLTLRQRGMLANELDVDLFVSLHVNATEGHSHAGYETFVLTPDAVDVDSRALRFSSGRKRPGMSPRVARLVDDLERSSTQERAAELAASIQEGFRELRGKAGDRGVRQDSMHVLLGATMPAILIEFGFIDHPIEGEELMNLELREKMADVVAGAIAKHAKALKERAGSE